MPSPDYGDSTFLQNTGIYIQVDMVSDTEHRHQHGTVIHKIQAIIGIKFQNKTLMTVTFEIKQFN
jgi:hypothetical protein